MPNVQQQQRSPRHTHNQSASRLHKSASVPKLLSSSTVTSAQVNSQPFRSGVKHHAFSNMATYPLSYHKQALASDALDHFTLKSIFQSCSAVDFSIRPPPTRCLDLGCGTGAWILEAAHEWPDCHFVGFDLVNIQLPPLLFPPALSKRIKWVHGSFLSPLPFGDAFFDHVYIRHIARGVPEDKWDSVVAEIARVLKVGGSVEIFEEDIIFPVLPRSCTAMPHQRIQKLPTRLYPAQPHTVDSATINYDPSEILPEHDHLVLEKLFYRVFERRFINVKPTALIMGTLNIHMRQVLGTPLINFPFPPTPFSEDPVMQTNASTRSITKVVDQRPTILIPSPRSSTFPDCDEDGPVSSTASSSWSSTLFSGTSPSETSASEPVIEDLLDGSIAFFSDIELANVSAKYQKSMDILPEERLRMTAGTLGLNLYKSWQGVMACREAMWDEFQLALEARDPLLDLIHWEPSEHTSSNRRNFDSLMERYQSDMEARYPMSNALVSDLNWKAPKRCLTADEQKAFTSIAEVRRDVLRLEKSNVLEVPEGSHICRKARIFVARKGAVFGTES